MVKELSPEQIKECIDEGLPLIDSAKKLGISRSFLAKKAQIFGLSFRKPKFDPLKYKELHDQGHTDKEIAKIFGMARHSMLERKEAFGFELQKRDFSEIPKEVLDALDPRGLAFWFMDDGSWYNKNGLLLCTDSFSQADLLLIQKYFKDKWNINVCISKGNRIIFKKNNATAFKNIINDHVLDSFKYKLRYI